MRNPEDINLTALGLIAGAVGLGVGAVIGAVYLRPWLDSYRAKKLAEAKKAAIPNKKA